MSDFDLASELYDSQFTNTRIGIAQRTQVWNAVDQLKVHNKASILEINCGTGKDASIWFDRGYSILSTDISNDMLAVAKQKYPAIDFQELDAKDLNTLSNKYDCIFSNFGGLNCLSPEELRNFFKSAKNLLSPSGKLVLVIMGKKCFWDQLFMFLKGKWKDIYRRKTDNSLSVNVDGKSVNTWYYSPNDIIKMAGNDFRMISKKPIGLFVPPSYLSSYFENKKLTMRILSCLDSAFGFSFLSNRSDHFYISLEKNNH